MKPFKYDAQIAAVVNGECGSLRVTSQTAKAQSLRQTLSRARARLNAPVRLTVDGDGVLITKKNT